MVPVSTGLLFMRREGSSKPRCGGMRTERVSPVHMPNMPFSMPLMMRCSPSTTRIGSFPLPSNCTICPSSPWRAPMWVMKRVSPCSAVLRQSPSLVIAMRTPLNSVHPGPCCCPSPPSSGSSMSSISTSSSSSSARTPAAATRRRSARGAAMRSALERPVLRVALLVPDLVAQNPDGDHEEACHEPACGFDEPCGAPVDLLFRDVEEVG
mmetsp:Transcript_41858/g.102611  ORF Transcript_41858/g.102611 Transcript_41858/m.102611 type:complete len:209 (-) Transcript_41858:82-708(-)